MNENITETDRIVIFIVAAVGALLFLPAFVYAGVLYVSYKVVKRKNSFLYTIFCCFCGCVLFFDY
jgi:hypothetical protein